jgi:hypothetical protein
VENKSLWGFKIYGDWELPTWPSVLVTLFGAFAGCENFHCVQPEPGQVYLKGINSPPEESYI